MTAPISVDVAGVSKWYPTGGDPVHALHDVNLTMKSGEFVSLLGPSGCGKSTLLLAMAGLISASDGEILIGDTVVQKPYTELGIVFQDSVLLDWLDVIGNVLLQADLRGVRRSDLRPRAEELLSMVDLSGFQDRRPFELSGGMRQRVSICRALVHDPPLLLMDEPFGALDALTRDQLNLDLQEIWLTSRPLVVFVTHSISEAVFLSDRVVVMSPRPGRVEAILEIDIPRPRHLAVRESAEFGAYANEIRQIFNRLGILHDE